MNDKKLIPIAEAVGTGEILNLSDYAKSIEYIPLETSNILIGDIEQLAYEKNRIVLRDFQNSICQIFNGDGSFLCQVGNKGEGPKEYKSVRSFNMDNSLNMIFLDANPRRFYFYDLDGNFLKQAICPEYPETYMPWQTVAMDTITLFSNLTSPKYRDIRGLLFNGNKPSEIELFVNYIDKDKLPEEINTWGGYDTADMWNYKDTLNYYRGLSDTIFSLTRDRLIVKRFVFDFGKYKTPVNTLLRGGDCNDKVGVSVIGESSNYLFFNIGLNNHAPEVFQRTFRNVRGKNVTITYKNACSIFDKSTGCLTLMNQPVKKQLGFRNDIDGGPTFWPTYISTDDKMVAWWNADEFLSICEQLENPSPKLKKLAEKLTPEDNPVLMIVTLK